jgi:hypothetical protein
MQIIGRKCSYHGVACGTVEVVKLAVIGQLEEAFSVAEEFRDMGVELMVELCDQINECQLQYN